jgi:hypothetical protein
MNNTSFNGEEAAQFLMSMGVDDGQLYQAAEEASMLMDPDDRDLCEVAEDQEMYDAVDEFERGRSQSKFHM